MELSLSIKRYGITMRRLASLMKHSHALHNRMRGCGIRLFYSKSQSDVSEQTMGLSLLIKHCGIIMKRLASLMRHLLHALHSKMVSLKDAEAVATACFTQNRSIIRLRHGKTPYELMHDKQPNLSYFHMFGALCYPTNDGENVRPALQEMTLGTISSGLMQKPSSSTSYVPPSRNDWDLLFQPLFDELLNPPPCVDNQNAEVIAPIAEVLPQVDDDSTGSPFSTAVDQDAPSPSKSLTPTEIQSPVILQDVGNDNLDIEVAHMGNDQLLSAPIIEVASGQSSSTTSPQTNVQPNHPMTYPNSKWTKDHPLNYIIGPLSRPVSTRSCFWTIFINGISPNQCATQ
nr:integrase, catalytic region, zinc finger, CCHC-type, peptidase aspartic, catalytic [Tanacetum cinerariifolium]